MLIKITNDQVFGMLNSMRNLDNVSGDAQFTRSLLKNQQTLGEHFKVVQDKIIQPPKEHADFLQERRDITEPYKAAVVEAKKETKDLPDKDAYEASLKALEEKYADTITKFKENEEANGELFKKEVELELRVILEEKVPKMTPAQMRPILPLIVDKIS